MGGSVTGMAAAKTDQIAAIIVKTADRIGAEMIGTAGLAQTTVVGQTTSAILRKSYT